MGQGVSPADAQVPARHSFRDETMRTLATRSATSALGVDSLVHDQLLSFGSYALQNYSSNGSPKSGHARDFHCEQEEKE